MDRWRWRIGRPLHIWPVAAVLWIVRRVQQYSILKLGFVLTLFPCQASRAGLRG